MVHFYRFCDDDEMEIEINTTREYLRYFGEAERMGDIRVVL